MVVIQPSPPSSLLCAGSVDQEMAPIKVEAANCLKHLTDVFQLQHNESVCYLAALMQLNIAEAASTDFDELIMAYSSIIQVTRRQTPPHRPPDRAQQSYEKRAATKLSISAKH